MTSRSQASKDVEQRNWFIARIHRNPRQASVIGLVLALMIFALVRGYVSDDANRTQLTDTAKERWALIQTAQENFYDENNRYAGGLDALEGVEGVLTTTAENLHLDIDLKEAGRSVEMTLTGGTITLSRTLTDGGEESEDCRILTSRAGSC